MGTPVTFLSDKINSEASHHKHADNILPNTLIISSDK